MFPPKSLVLTLVISMLICMCVCRPSMEARPRAYLDNASRFRRSGEINPCVKSRKIDAKTGIKIAECYESSPFGCTQNVFKTGSTLCKPVVGKTRNGNHQTIIDCVCA
ncbi:uncharacterized protein LOC116286489 [Actinia tenebrosa]|uniref:Uncharacterized protein LOC116286489 n=1 Tax=Actinia tenebrosa TaxID=6105 RepID=A0A6P8GZD8_ACTTE|nr:uncharacterized protein LOC116286489 [Actinia tenebrosa]